MNVDLDDVINRLWDMAVSYKLGTPESRAIVTAIDHMVATVKRNQS